MPRTCQELFSEFFAAAMTEDFPLAIADESTTIRIGTALFGPREEKPQVRTCAIRTSLSTVT
jgi:hypothetical protein